MRYHKRLDSMLQSLGLYLLSTVLYEISWRVNKILHCSKSNLKRHDRAEVWIRKTQSCLPPSKILEEARDTEKQSICDLFSFLVIDT